MILGERREIGLWVLESVTANVETDTGHEKAPVVCAQFDVEDHEHDGLTIWFDGAEYVIDIEEGDVDLPFVIPREVMLALAEMFDAAAPAAPAAPSAPVEQPAPPAEPKANE